MRNILFGALLLFVPFTIHAAPEYQEGVHYSEVVPEQPGAEGKRIQVVEFFMYGCGHCNSFEPYLQEWLKKKPDDVEFVKVPAMFDRPSIIFHARVFYALNVIGADAEIHSKIFHAIHEGNKKLSSDSTMDAFLKDNGVDMDKYHDAMKSFTILTSIRKAAVLAENFGLHGVPALAVDGKYLIPGQEGETMIGVVDHLIEKVRKTKAAAVE